MSKPKPNITIVGLGLIGTSMGLALRQAGVASAVIGHDKDLAVANQARKREAVDKVDWNLISACEKADLVILAVPLDAIEPTLKAIGPYLRPGCVVIDTANLKAPVLDWAQAALPEQVHFVGGDPVLDPAAAGHGEPHASLFQEALFCLVPAPQADAAAVKLAADLATLVGAQPFFMDAAEHDGLVVAVEHLPVLVSLALLETAVNEPGWRELRKVAGTSFVQATQPVESNAAAVASAATATRDSLLHWLDALSATLASLRQDVAAGDPAVLAERLETAVKARDKWLADRAAHRLLETEPPTQMPSKAEMFDAFLGGFVRRTLTRDRTAPGQGHAKDASRRKGG